MRASTGFSLLASLLGVCLAASNGKRDDSTDSFDLFAGTDAQDAKFDSSASDMQYTLSGGIP